MGELYLNIYLIPVVESISDFPNKADIIERRLLYDSFMVLKHVYIKITLNLVPNFTIQGVPKMYRNFESL